MALPAKIKGNTTKTSTHTRTDVLAGLKGTTPSKDIIDCVEPVRNISLTKPHGFV